MIFFFPKGDGATNTVSGTITEAYYSISGPLTITISDGAKTYSTQANLSGSIGADSADYSISGLPTGTYTVTVSFTCNSYSSGVSYSVDGIAQTSPAITAASASGGSPYDVTVSIEGLGISATETLDIDLGSLG